tara:strand:- start:1565 stop:1684 length:120 start_codon:yes stop_codon:yes gene_type:complete
MLDIGYYIPGNVYKKIGYSSVHSSEIMAYFGVFVKKNNK